MSYDPPTSPASPPPYIPGSPPEPTAYLGPPIPAPTTRKRKTWPWIAGGAAALVLLCCGGLGVIGALAEEPAAEQAAAPAAVSTTPAATTPAAAPVTSAPAAPTTKAAPPPKPKPIVYKALTARQWKLIVKDPNAYRGQTFVVFGSVLQFDSATGPDRFLAYVEHKNMAESYEYETNTILKGTAAMLAKVVEDDEFRANVTVLGDYSYDTQIGGNTTVPMLHIASIRVL